MTRTAMIVMVALWAIACTARQYANPDAEADGETDCEVDTAPPPEDRPEICGDGIDNDGDSAVDEPDCVPREDTSTEDAATDTVEDAPEDTLGDVPEDTGTDPDVAEDTATDTATDTVTDTTEEDVPPPPTFPARLAATFREGVLSPGDAVETRLWDDLPAAAASTMPGRPDALCAHGSWNDWSYTDGRICMIWPGVTPSATSPLYVYHQGGDTGFFFSRMGSHYDLDLGRVEIVDADRCYRTAVSVSGTTRLVLRCPTTPGDAICSDGLDNDHDGVYDTADPDCDTIWEPPTEPVMVNMISGDTVGTCTNFVGTFWFHASDFGLARPLATGEWVNRFTMLYDQLDHTGGVVSTACTTSPCSSVDYSFDPTDMSAPARVRYTLCNYYRAYPAVITSHGDVVKIDLATTALAGDLCSRDSNQALASWALGNCLGSPPPSGTEVCDGADNDADGLVDEGFACPAGSTGSCTASCGSTGTRTCSTSCTWNACSPPAEACNGLDDDCDGWIDEDSVCGGGTTEVCDGVDNDGDTLVDEDGVCSGGGTTEVCDGVDNDGDTLIDEDGVCSGGSTDPWRYRIELRTFGGQHEIMLHAHLNDDHSLALASNHESSPADDLATSENIGSICVVYGDDRWEDQYLDPYAYHTTPDPCVPYSGDGVSNYLYIPSDVSTFMLFAVGNNSSYTPRHRQWFSVGEWTPEGLHVNSDTVFQVNSTSGSGTYSILGTDFGSYREIEIHGDIDAHSDTALAHESGHMFDSDESVQQLCVAYGHVDWWDQMSDPWVHRSSTDHDPCIVYGGDGSYARLTMPAATYNFMVYAIGNHDNRVWINLSDSGWGFTNIDSSTGVLVFTF